jgi:hypothetical protein
LKIYHLATLTSRRDARKTETLTPKTFWNGLFYLFVLVSKDKDLDKLLCCPADRGKTSYNTSTQHVCT